MHAPGRLLLLRGSEALLGDQLQPAEYLGAVCDLVGEIRPNPNPNPDPNPNPNPNPKPDPKPNPNPKVGEIGRFAVRRATERDAEQAPN